MLQHYIPHHNHPGIYCYLVTTRKVGLVYQTSIYPVKDHFYASHPWIEVDWENGEHYNYQGWFKQFINHRKAIKRAKQKVLY